MPRREITPKQIWQDLKESFFKEDAALDPEYIERFYTSNLVQRTLAHLVGQADKYAVRIKATSAGELKVAPSGTGYEHNETIAKFSVGDSYTTKTFSQVVSRVDITTWDYAIIIQRRPTATSGWEDAIQIPANTHYSFDCSTQALNVKNATAGQTASCQIVGWY